jgi:predicted lipoprotein with Yx(FWY)xxD motif
VAACGKAAAARGIIARGGAFIAHDASTWRRPMRVLLITVMTILLAACAVFEGAPAPARLAEGAWVTAEGYTLYTFDRDTAGSGKSVCNGPCAASWPPLKVVDEAQARGDWSAITRDDGSRQWAYKGKPVYTWIKDQKPGDRTGEGVNNVWRIARP